MPHTLRIPLVCILLGLTAGGDDAGTGGTSHRHLDLRFQRVDPPPATPPVSAVQCPL